MEAYFSFQCCVAILSQIKTKIEEGLSQETEDAIIEEEQSALHTGNAEAAVITKNESNLETGTENAQTFINDNDSDLSSDSDDEPDVITNTVNLFPANNASNIVGKPGDSKNPNVAVPRDIGTVVKPTAGETPEVKAQGDSAFTIYDADTLDEEKPWLQDGADPSDYFNYGFDEESWRIYCERQRMIRAGLDPLSARHIMDRKKRPNYADKDPEGDMDDHHNNNMNHHRNNMNNNMNHQGQKQSNNTFSIEEAAKAAAMQAILAGGIPGMTPGAIPGMPGIGAAAASGGIPGLAGLPGFPGLNPLEQLGALNPAAAAVPVPVIQKIQPNLDNLKPPSGSSSKDRVKSEAREYENRSHRTERDSRDSRNNNVRDRSPNYREKDRYEREYERYKEQQSQSQNRVSSRNTRDVRDYEHRDPHGRGGDGRDYRRRDDRYR